MKSHPKWTGVCCLQHYQKKSVKMLVIYSCLIYRYIISVLSSGGLIYYMAVLTRFVRQDPSCRCISEALNIGFSITFIILQVIFIFKFAQVKCIFFSIYGKSEHTGWGTKIFPNANSLTSRPVAHDRIIQTKPNLEI